MKKVVLIVILFLLGLLAYKAIPYYQLFQAKSFDNIAFDGERINVTIDDDIDFNLDCSLLTFVINV